MSNCICSNLISIIIPAYNICNELGPCLDSILAQTHTNIEVIIVNDGSKDGTASVMEHYATLDSRVKVIHKENGGVTSARLRGVQEATGEWIGFVDGDDYIEPQMYTRLLDNAKKYHADISHCGYRMVFPSRVDYYYNTERITEQDHATALKDLISGDFVEPALWNKLYKRSLFDKLLTDKLMDPTIRNYEDLLMNFYLFRESGKSVFEDFCPYHYMLRPGSAATSRINEHKLLDPLRVLNLIRSDTTGDTTLKNHIDARILRMLINLSTMSAKHNPELIIPNRKKSRKELRALVSSAKNNPVCSKRLFLMGLWAGYLPHSYQFVHWLHNKITGNDKKYEVK